MKKFIKLLVIVSILCMILLPCLVACNEDESETTNLEAEQLVIYNWEDYIDPTLLDDFCEYYEDITGHPLEITYTTFDTNETMMTKVIQGDCNVDLICPSEYSIQKLLVAGCLENEYEIYQEIKPQLDKLGIDLKQMNSSYTIDEMQALIDDDSEIGVGNVDKFIIDKIMGTFSNIKANDGKTYNMAQYMVPYMWGTLGILYNTKYLTEEELDEYGWGVLWNRGENQDIENMILMKDSVRDSYAASVFYMYQYGLLPEGYENISADELINCTDDAVVLKAEEVLTEQRNHISGYEVDFGKDDMLNEIVYVDFAWSGDALWAIEESYDEETDEYLLDYYVPDICSNIWYDGWVVPKSVNNKLAAMMFIDYCCDPMSAIRNSMEIGYSSAVAKDIIRTDEGSLDFILENEYCDVELTYTDGVWIDEYDEEVSSHLLDAYFILESITYDEANDVYYDSESNIIDTLTINEYFLDERRYPLIDEKLGMMRDYGDRNEVVVNMWQRAKSGSTVEHSLWWVLLVVIGIIGVSLLTYFISQRAKLRPRKLL